MKFAEFDATMLNQFANEGCDDWRMQKQTPKETTFVRESEKLGFLSMLKASPSNDGQVYSLRMMHRWGILRDPNQAIALINENYGGVDNGPFYFSVHAQKTESGFLFTIFLECWTKVIDFSKDEMDCTLVELLLEPLLFRQYLPLNIDGIEQGLKC